MTDQQTDDTTNQDGKPDDGGDDKHPLQQLYDPPGDDDTTAGGGGDDDTTGGNADDTTGGNTDDDVTDDGDGKDKPTGADASKKDGDQKGTKGDGDGDDSSDEGSELEFAPEAGYGKFTYPEDAPVDDALEKSFMDYAMKLNGGKGLSQDDAQGLIDFQLTDLKGAYDRAAAATHEFWAQQSNADPRYGGAKAAQSEKHIDAFLTLVENSAITDNYEPAQNARKVLEATGFLKEPSIRRLLALAGEQLTAEPGPPEGSRTPQTDEKPDLATPTGRGKVLYDNPRRQRQRGRG